MDKNDKLIMRLLQKIKTMEDEIASLKLLLFSEYKKINSVSGLIYENYKRLN